MSRRKKPKPKKSQGFRKRVDAEFFWDDKSDAKAKPIVQKAMTELMRDLIKAGVTNPAITSRGER